jgi:SPP1 family predicted phage head-tail adaptor
MSNFKVEIKSLNKRITIQKLSTITFDSEGFPEDPGGVDGSFKDYKKLWASINNLFGNEFWSAKAVQSENTVEFIVRYSKELENMDSKNYRIKFEQRLFNITFIDNIKYENRWLKIKALEVV